MFWRMRKKFPFASQLNAFMESFRQPKHSTYAGYMHIDSFSLKEAENGLPQGDHDYSRRHFECRP